MAPFHPFLGISLVAELRRRRTELFRYIQVAMIVSYYYKIGYAGSCSTGSRRDVL